MRVISGVFDVSRCHPVFCMTLRISKMLWKHGEIYSVTWCPAFMSDSWIFVSMYHEMKSLKFIEMKHTQKNKSIMIKKWLKGNKPTEGKKNENSCQNKCYFHKFFHSYYHLQWWYFFKSGNKAFQESRYFYVPYILRVGKVGSSQGYFWSSCPLIEL